MNLRKLVAIITMFIVVCQTVMCSAAYDFWIDSIEPEKSENYVERADWIVNRDTKLIKDIATQYSNLYVVTLDESLDTTPIDNYLSSCCEPLTLEELDSGSSKFNHGDIYDTQEHKEYAETFRNFAGPCNLQVYFEPLVSYNIYRNIKVVGGYYDYSDCNLDVQMGLWNTEQYVQNLTKEIVQWDTKVVIKKQINDLYYAIKHDTGLKAFIIVDGAVKSVYSLN